MDNFWKKKIIFILHQSQFQFIEKFQFLWKQKSAPFIICENVIIDTV